MNTEQRNSTNWLSRGKGNQYPIIQACVSKFYASSNKKNDLIMCRNFSQKPKRKSKPETEKLAKEPIEGN